MLALIHQLEEKKIETKLKALEYIFNQKFIAIKTEGALTELNQSKISKALVLNLDIETEIQTHRTISKDLQALAIQELNPYQDIFENKFKFNNYLKANNFEVIKTYLKRQEAKSNNKWVIKPINGTEGIDTEIHQDLDSAEAIYLRNKIEKYSVPMFQKYIDADAEYKVLVIEEKFFITRKTGDLEYTKSVTLTTIENIQNLIFELKSCFKDDGINSEIFSVDILKKEGVFYILEINSRPSAIERFVE